MHSSNTRVLPYQQDSELFMRALDTFAMPAFLDSASHGGRSGRRDILAAAPIAHIILSNGKISCSENIGERIGDSRDSKILLKNIRWLKDTYLPLNEQLKGAVSDDDFAGAVIAHLGYPELKHSARFHINDGFVGVYLWTLIIDHEENTCELRFHPGCDQAYIDETASSINNALDTVEGAQAVSFSLYSNFQSSSSFEEYQRAFTDIKMRIDSGDCYQVNLTQSFTAKGDGEPLAAYLRLRRATTAPFSAYLNWDSGALLSLSPERFLRLADKAVLTQPIKGTRPRGSTKKADTHLAEDLLASEKDRAENLMIVDLLRNDLGRVCQIGSIKVKQLFSVESYSNVHHMVSDVSGTLRADRDALDLLASCYPGGSITGAPKLSAMTIIQRLEQVPRRAYCGTVFYLDSQGNFDSSITIRSLLWEANELTCWAGGGIVADSECEQEYQECFDKINNIFSVLQD